MFAAGISAGFFIFERLRIISGILIMASVAAVICLAGTDAKVRNRLIISLAAGFALFTLRYIWYGTGLVQTEAEADGWGSRNTLSCIEGLVRSASVKDGKMKIVLCDTDSVRRGMKVIVNIRVSDNSDGKDSSEDDTYEYRDDREYDPAYITGRRIRAYGTLREPSGADNPGCFDYRVYLRGRGIGYTFSAKSIDCSDEENGIIFTRLYGGYIRRLYLIRESFLDVFSDDDCRAFIKGAVFGDKTDISEEVLKDFNGNGTGHILAVSGLHTGFLYALLRFITRRRRSIPSALFIITVLFLYGEMTLWSPSTMRAVTVLSVSIMAIYVRRPFDLLSAVSAAAVLILTREPYQLFSTGFQMSFLALLGIAFLAKPLSHFTGEAFAVMLSVQMAMMPVTALYFHRINALSIFINIPVIFLASVLVPVSIFALILSALNQAIVSLKAGIISYLISGGLARLTSAIVFVSEGMTELILKLNSIMSAGGIFSDQVTSPSAGLIFLFYLCVFMLSSEWCRVRLLRHEKRKILFAFMCILAVSGSFALASRNVFRDDEIVFVSVGQGDCTHIRAGGKDVLIDGGGSTERNTGEDVLMPYLLANGAERTEIALVTHLHTDHYLGISELSEIYPVGTVGIPSDYRKSVEKIQQDKESENTYETSGESSSDNYGSGLKLPDRITFIDPASRINITEDVYIEPVWPPPGTGSSIDIDDPNEHNMVYMVCYKGIRIMVTGDLLEEDELKMIDYYSGTDTLNCDILKVAHHGSKSSSSEAFLDAASPEIAVIQVGLNNFYGHPHQQTLDRLGERGIPVYRTDLNGAVGIDIRRGRLFVDTTRDVLELTHGL